MFDSQYTDYKCTNTQAGRDLVREYVDAFRAELTAYYKTCPEPEHPALECELRIEDPAMLSMECVESLELLEPYGKVDELDAFFEEGCTGPGKREAR